MFDTMTSTKVIGALSGTLLIFLLANWLASSLYSVESGSSHEEKANAYVIETDEAPTEEMAGEPIDFAAILAAADAEKGARVFGKCAACHALEAGVNKTGPSLFAVFGRDIGSVADYGYSGALGGMTGTWNGEALNAFLENPKGFAPGTKMSASLKKLSERANVIAYLSSIGG